MSNENEIIGLFQPYFFQLKRGAERGVSGSIEPGLDQSLVYYIGQDTGTCKQYCCHEFANSLLHGRIQRGSGAPDPLPERISCAKKA